MRRSLLSFILNRLIGKLQLYAQHESHFNRVEAFYCTIKLISILLLVAAMPILAFTLLLRIKLIYVPFCSPEVAAQWNKRWTLKQNMDNMGLAYDVNKSVKQPKPKVLFCI